MEVTNRRKVLFHIYLINTLSSVGIIVLGAFFEGILQLGVYLQLITYSHPWSIFFSSLAVAILLIIFQVIKTWLGIRKNVG
jgi:hypothetical protein